MRRRRMPLFAATFCVYGILHLVYYLIGLKLIGLISTLINYGPKAFSGNVGGLVKLLIDVALHIAFYIVLSKYISVASKDDDEDKARKLFLVICILHIFVGSPIISIIFFIMYANYYSYFVYENSSGLFSPIALLFLAFLFWAFHLIVGLLNERLMLFPFIRTGSHAVVIISSILELLMIELVFELNSSEGVMPFKKYKKSFVFHLVVTLIVALVIIGIIFGVMKLVDVLSEEESEINKIGSSIDWGPDYYWDTNDESIKRKPWRPWRFE